MTPDEALQEMRTNPDYFFKHYPVRMEGATGSWMADAQNLRPYKLGRLMAGQTRNAVTATRNGHFGARRPGRILGSWRMHEISSFRMEPARDVQRVPTERSQTFTAEAVPMIDFNGPAGGNNLYGNVTNMNFYEAGRGSDFMVTGQLSGCCFAWCNQGGVLRCAHIQPFPLTAITGVALQTLIETTGRFRRMPHATLTTFGKRETQRNTASVIGVRARGQLHLYAQTSSNGFNTINGAWRLYPGFQPL